MNSAQTLIATLAITSAVASATGAQQSSTSKVEGHLSYAKLQTLLQQPDGLRKATAYTGDLEINKSVSRWADYDLPSLAKSSDLILCGSIVSRSSHLSDGGKSIETTYLLKIDGPPYKGNANGEMAFDSSGGSVLFDNNHTATIHTEEWDSIRVGQRLLLFLRSSPGGYRVFGGLQGIATISGPDSEVSVLDHDTARVLDLRHEVDGLPLSEVAERIRALPR